MGGAIVCIAAVLLGVDASWPPLPDGGLQYVIRIEPQVFARLESGAIEAVGSHVPRDLDDIRAFQIVIGTQQSAGDAPTPGAQSPILSNVDNTQWVSLPTGGVECRVWIPPGALDELDTSGRVIEGAIPVNVDKLSLFTITVGTKPPAESFPVANGSGASDLGMAGRLPADLPFTSPITEPYLTKQPDPPPRLDRPFSFAPHTPTVPTVGNPEPSLPPSEAGAGSRPIPVQRTNHVEPAKTTPNEQPRKNADLTTPAENGPAAKNSNKLPLSPTVTLFVLFASLAGNLFLFWVMRDFRNRYRALLRRVGEVGDVVGSCAVELEQNS